jgi:hypothetical protein
VQILRLAELASVSFLSTFAGLAHHTELAMVASRPCVRAADDRRTVADGL